MVLDGKHSTNKLSERRRRLRPLIIAVTIAVSVVCIEWKLWLSSSASTSAPVIGKTKASIAISANSSKGGREATIDNFEEWVAASSAQNLFYIKARTDRSGSAVLDMLMAHAYAFHNNRTLAGVCPQEELPFRQANEDLLRSLGLDAVFRYSCPPQFSTDEQKAFVSESFFIENFEYRKYYLTRFTAEWLSWVKNRMIKAEIWTRRFNTSSSRTSQLLQTAGDPLSSLSEEDMSSVVTVAMHIRRGDLDLFNRYLPLSHYQRIFAENILPFHRYMKVLIFSESDSPFESWANATILDPKFDLLEGKRVEAHLILDASLEATWQGIMTADIVVMSCSSFSYVPSVLNFQANQFWYTPYRYYAMGHWLTVSNRLLARTKTDLGELRKQFVAQKETKS